MCLDTMKAAERSIELGRRFHSKIASISTVAWSARLAVQCGRAQLPEGCGNVQPTPRAVAAAHTAKTCSGALCPLSHQRIAADQGHMCNYGIQIASASYESVKGARRDAWACLSSIDRRCAADGHSWITSQSCTSTPGPAGTPGQQCALGAQGAEVEHCVRKMRQHALRRMECEHYAAGSASVRASTFAAAGLPGQLERPQQHVALCPHVKALSERHSGLELTQCSHQAHGRAQFKPLV